MAVLNVTTFTKLARDAEGNVTQAAQHPATGVANIPFTTTAGNGPDFDGTSKVVRLHSDANCFYLIGPGVTATTSTGVALPADTVEYVSVNQGDRISVIQA